MAISHGTRAHSPFSASGAERWFNCPASVALQEGLPDTDSPWARQGTAAHEVLETMFKAHEAPALSFLWPALEASQDIAVKGAMSMIKYVERIRKTLVDPELLIEARVLNTDIHPEMFGTVDAALVEVFGQLHVFDFKFGMSKVDPKENRQMIQYALGLAERYDWQFTTVVVHICQPRVPGNEHKAWVLSIDRLKRYKGEWLKAVEAVNADPKGKSPVPGAHCHFCKAKNICPAKQGIHEEKIADRFRNNPFKERQANGKEENNQESETSGGQKESRQKAKGQKARNPFAQAKSLEDGEETKGEARFAHGVRNGVVYSTRIF